MKLANKTAIVTGAMKGIGRAAAQAFVEEGANVLLVDLDESQLKAAVEEIGTEKADYLVADISTAEGNQAMAQKAKDRFGQIHIFFANAGLGGTPTKLLELSEEDWDHIMNVNLKGVFLGMKAVVPHIIEAGGGSVVITSSLAGLMGSPKASVYAASKHGVVGLMKSASAEWARYNINVNTVNPGPIETDMVRDLEKTIAKGQPEMGKAFLQQRIPFRRYGTPEEVARLAVFLCEEHSRYITGTVHRIDGGMSAY
ncbi:MAG: SDR family NAD(P)-dependent oxidoreductase [Bacteroidota bacterium]